MGIWRQPDGQVAPPRRRRIGVFGGTFDPIHVGHLIAAREAAERLGLDLVLLVPAGRPPHKCRRRLAPAADRIRMAALAVRGDPLFRVSRIEVDARCVSYTAETLQRLRQDDRRPRLYLLIGADQAALLGTWRDPARLFRLAAVCALSRPGYQPEWIHPRWRRRLRLVPVPAIEISASDIRRRVGRGREIRHLVPPAVERYIMQHGLYRR